MTGLETLKKEMLEKIGEMHNPAVDAAIVELIDELAIRGRIVPDGYKAFMVDPVHGQPIATMTQAGIAQMNRWNIDARYKAEGQIHTLTVVVNERDATIKKLREEIKAKPRWRDMDTAPKNGTKILLFWPYWSWEPCVGFWDEKSTAENKWSSECCLSDVPQYPEAWQALPSAPAIDEVKKL